jgi:hypothetical protein
MNSLTNEQLKELHGALLDAFRGPDLEMLVRYNYPSEFTNVVNWTESFDQVVFNLLLQLQNRHDFEPLLRSMLQARPKVERIQEFCRLHFPAALAPANPTDLVKRVTTGLEALIGMLRDPAARLVVGRFRADLDTARERIRTVTAYKTLHDGLHNVSQRLALVVDAAENFPHKAAPRTLMNAAYYFKSESRRCREAANRTPSPKPELEWVNELDEAIVSLQAAPLPGNEELPKNAAESLRALLVHLVRINGLLCGFAADMKLGALIAALMEIDKRLSDPTASDGPGARLRMGQSALKALRAEFSRRVEEHQDWQSLDRVFSLAENSREFEPKKKVKQWSIVSQRLDLLCNLFPDEVWYGELQEWRKVWEQAAEAGEREAALASFDTLRTLASQRFFDVDAELKALCDRLNEIAISLEALLGVLTHDVA